MLQNVDQKELAGLKGRKELVYKTLDLFGSPKFLGMVNEDLITTVKDLIVTIFLMVF